MQWMGALRSTSRTDVIRNFLPSVVSTISPAFKSVTGVNVPFAITDAPIGSVVWAPVAGLTRRHAAIREMAMK
jgi:hypothetical protein